MSHRLFAGLTPVFTCLLLGIASAGNAAAATPVQMQAIVQTGMGGPEVLQLRTVPVLAPGPGQVLIRVHAAAVNPVDWGMRQPREGAAPTIGVAPTARIPGFDVAGVIEKVGPGVTTHRVGDAVFSMIGRIRTDGLNGGYAEYVIAPEQNTVMKPAAMTFAQAAGLGTVGMTAARTLAAAKVGPGTRLFVNGVSGGVGSTVAQLAKARGAHVIGTASARHHDYLRSLGVDEIIDYRSVAFETVVRNVDAVIDTVNAEGATRAVKVLKRGGILVSIAGNPPAADCSAAGIECPGPGSMREMDGKGGSEGDFLREAAAVAASGKLSINVDSRFPLARAGDAQEENRNGGTQGKIILIVNAAEADRK
jgi:NADPH:quinone reductase-like Zn-dependent oxidoreductase